MPKYCFFFLFFSVFFLSFSAKAQTIDDWEARPSISLQYKIDKKWDVKGTYYSYFDEDISNYHKSVFKLRAGYKFDKMFKAQIGAKHGIKHYKGNYQELRAAGRFKYKLSKKWQLRYRLMYAQRLGGDVAEHFMRNRVKFRYKFNKKVNVYAMTENYQQIYHGFKFHRQKTALGARFTIHKRHKIDPRIYLINWRKKHRQRARIGLNYTYIID